MEAQNRTKNTFLAGEISSFCEQVAMIVGAGIPLYSGMEAIKSTYRGHKSEAQFTKVCDEVIQNGSLHEALKAVPGYPKYMIEMVYVGEMTGRLDKVMMGLADHYRREDELKQAVRNAAAYPMVLGVMVTAILVVMVFRLIPIFRNVLAGMGLSMTDGSTAFLRVGTLIGVVMLVVMLLGIILAASGLLLSKTKLRDKIVAIVERIFPPLSRMRAQRSAARTASVMSMLLSSGIPLEEAFRTAAEVLGDELAKDKILQMVQAVQNGSEVGDAVADTGLFDDVSSCLIRTGGAVGLLDTTMEKIADDYKQRAEQSLVKLSSAIEPTLVGLLAVVIGGVLLSLVLPMGGIISGLL